MFGWGKGSSGGCEQHRERQCLLLPSQGFVWKAAEQKIKPFSEQQTFVHLMNHLMGVFNLAKS